MNLASVLIIAIVVGYVSFTIYTYSGVAGVLAVALTVIVASAIVGGYRDYKFRRGKWRG